MNPDHPLATTAAALRPVGLGDIGDDLMLLERVDRKYVVPEPTVAQLVKHLSGDLAVLEIGGRRTFAYESSYFDTPTWASFHGAATGRRQRFKARTRRYVDTGTVMLEVKVRSGRGVTRKTRQPRPDASPALTDAEIAFIEEVAGRPGIGGDLRAVLLTAYQRTSLVAESDSYRVTVDLDLRCGPPGCTATVSVPDAIVEIKSAGPPTVADRWLWANGHRPLRLSKFGIGMVATYPALRGNRWHRALTRHADLAR